MYSHRFHRHHRHSPFISLSLFLFLFLLLAPCASTHGVLSVPPPRGALHKTTEFIYDTLNDPTAPHDFNVHFPAGNKSPRPGSGLLSQKIAANYYWTPYNPFSPSFRWRAGVCGDLVNSAHPAHLRGGEFYHGARVVKTYTQGQVISLAMSVAAHHNGYIEAHVCDVSKCAGEISTHCFQQGHCTQLMRARNAVCDSATSSKCGPIDRNFPGRWYLPCSRYPRDDAKVEYYGRGDNTISYVLPPYLNCQHCVLQWYWTAANTCNPPGVLHYFDGPDAPRWGNCWGQGDARGGVARNKHTCGGSRFPEEYYTCSDISIRPSSPTAPQQRPPSNPVPVPVPAPPSTPSPVAMPSPRSGAGGRRRSCRQRGFTYNVNKAFRTNYGAVRDIVLVTNDGCRVGSLLNMPLVPRLNNVRFVDVSKLSAFSIEAIVMKRVRSVTLQVNRGNMFKHRAKARPFYMAGQVRGWPINVADRLPLNQVVTIAAKAAGDYDAVKVYVNTRRGLKPRDVRL